MDRHKSKYSLLNLLADIEDGTIEKERKHLQQQRSDSQKESESECTSDQASSQSESSSGTTESHNSKSDSESSDSDSDDSENKPLKDSSKHLEAAVAAFAKAVKEDAKMKKEQQDQVLEAEAKASLTSRAGLISPSQVEEAIRTTKAKKAKQNTSTLKRTTSDKKAALDGSEQFAWLCTAKYSTLKACCMLNVSPEVYSIERVYNETQEWTLSAWADKQNHMADLIRASRSLNLEHEGEEKGKKALPSKKYFLALSDPVGVCKNCFCKSYDISQRKFRQIKQEAQRSTTILHGNSSVSNASTPNLNRSTDTKRRQAAAAWLARYAMTYGEKMPHKQEVQLQIDSVKTLHEMYKAQVEKEDVNGDVLDKAISYQSFQHVWHQLDDVVVMPRYQKFARCEICDKLDAKMRSKNSVRRDRAEAKKALHRALFMAERDLLDELIDQAKKHPDKILYLALDGMTQNTTLLPNLLHWNKKLAACTRVPTSVYGGIAHGPAEPGACIFVNHGEYHKDSSFTCQAILRMLQTVREQRGGLAEKLVLNLDGTSRENKNHAVVTLCSLLVEHGVFDEVEVFFLIPGHTHNQVDQIWSCISKALKKRGALSGCALEGLIYSSYSYDKRIKPHLLDIEVRTANHDVTSTDNHKYLTNQL